MQTTVDAAKVEAFGERMGQIINSAGISMAVSLGHQTGLLDRLADLPPASSEQIAAAAGLNERYVREWLALMTAGGIVEYDPQQRTYRLPPEHAALLTRSAGADNMATFSWLLSDLDRVSDKIAACFRNGGGVPYSEFEGFQENMAELNNPIFDATLLDAVLPLAPGLTERLQQGIEAVDVGCGSGHALRIMARAFPNSRFTGYDFSEEGIAMAREETERLGLPNVTFEVKDVSTLTGPPRFDLVTAFDAIHDQAQPRRVLKGIADVLKPDGVFLAADIDGTSRLEEDVANPFAPLFYTISLFHCMTVSLALDGEGLGTMWGERKARELFGEAGFSDIRVERVDGDLFNVYYILRK